MKIIDYVKNSTEDQWHWLKETPGGFGLFFNNSDILACVVKRLEQIPDIDMFDVLTRSNENLASGDTILHALVKEPLNETKIEIIMDLLQKGFHPGLKNKSGASFLDGSKFKDFLVTEIQAAPDSWAQSLFQSWTTGGESMINDNQSFNTDFKNSC